MKAAATLNINNGNPQENKLQRESPQRRAKRFDLLKIHCMANAVPWRQSFLFMNNLETNDARAENRNLLGAAFVEV